MPNFKLKQTSEQVQKAIDNALYPDKELTKEGVPADSKSVGIEIKKNSIHISNEPPTSGETVWIDTDESDGTQIDVIAQPGQIIAVKEVDANGKPTAWEAADYPIRRAETVPQTTLTGLYSDVFGCYMYDFPGESLIAGRTYTVIFDGVEYVRTAEEANLNGMSGVYIGNGVLIGNDTGEPFSFVSVYGAELGMTILLFDDNQHTVSVTYKYSDAHPYYLEATAEWDGYANSDPTNYVFYDTARNLANAYNSGRDIKMRVVLAGHESRLKAIYTLTAAGNGVYLFVLPIGQNTSFHHIALVGGFVTALPISDQGDGTLGIYEY